MPSEAAYAEAHGMHFESKMLPCSTNSMMNELDVEEMQLNNASSFQSNMDIAGKGRHCILCHEKKLDIDVALHSFPAERKKRKEWLKFCKLTQRDLYIGVCLCEQHFAADDYITFKEKKLLKPNAVPSYYDCSNKNATDSEKKEVIENDHAYAMPKDAVAPTNVNVANDPLHIDDKHAMPKQAVASTNVANDPLHIEDEHTKEAAAPTNVNVAANDSLHSDDQQQQICSLTQPNQQHFAPTGMPAIRFLVPNNHGFNFSGMPQHIQAAMPMHAAAQPRFLINLAPPAYNIGNGYVVNAVNPHMQNIAIGRPVQLLQLSPATMAPKPLMKINNEKNCKTKTRIPKITSVSSSCNKDYAAICQAAVDDVPVVNEALNDADDDVPVVNEALNDADDDLPLSDAENEFDIADNNKAEESVAGRCVKEEFMTDNLEIEESIVCDYAAEEFVTSTTQECIAPRDEEYQEVAGSYVIHQHVPEEQYNEAENDDSNAQQFYEYPRTRNRIYRYFGDVNCADFIEIPEVYKILKLAKETIDKNRKQTKILLNKTRRLRLQLERCKPTIKDLTEQQKLSQKMLAKLKQENKKLKKMNRANEKKIDKQVKKQENDEQAADKQDDAEQLLIKVAKKAARKKNTKKKIVVIKKINKKRTKKLQVKKQKIEAQEEPEEPQHDAQTNDWRAQLNALDDEQREIAENAMADILFYAGLRTLNSDSVQIQPDVGIKFEVECDNNYSVDIET